MTNLIVVPQTNQPRPGFTKATVSAWRVALEARSLGSVSINVRITAVRKLAAEVADNGLLAEAALATPVAPPARKPAPTPPAARVGPAQPGTTTGPLRNAAPPANATRTAGSSRTRRPGEPSSGVIPAW